MQTFVNLWPVITWIFPILILINSFLFNYDEKSIVSVILLTIQIILTFIAFKYA